MNLYIHLVLLSAQTVKSVFCKAIIEIIRDYKDETNTEIKTENKSEVNLDIIQNDKNSHNNYNFEKENKLILYSEQKLKGTLNFNIMCVIKFLYHKSSITIMFICMFINSNV